MRGEHSQVYHRLGRVDYSSAQRVRGLEGTSAVARVALDRHERATSQRESFVVSGDDRQVGRACQELRVVSGAIRQHDETSEQEENNPSRAVREKSKLNKTKKINFIRLGILKRDFASATGLDYSRSSVSLFTLQSEINELEHDLSLRQLLWQSIDEWDQLVRAWLAKLIDEIKVDLIQKDVNRFTQNVYMLEKGLPGNELVPRLKEKIMDFKKALPIIVALRNSNLKPRHYAQIKVLIGHDLVVDKEKITMSVLLNTDVSPFLQSKIIIKYPKWFCDREREI